MSLQLLVTNSFHRKHVHNQITHTSEGSKHTHTVLECHDKGNIRGMWAHSDPVLVNEKTIYSFYILQVKKANTEQTQHKTSKFYLIREGREVTPSSTKM